MVYLPNKMQIFKTDLLNTAYSQWMGEKSDGTISPKKCLELPAPQSVVLLVKCGCGGECGGGDARGLSTLFSCKGGASYPPAWQLVTFMLEVSGIKPMFYLYCNNR